MDNQQVSIQRDIRVEGLTSVNLPCINKYKIDFVRFIDTIAMDLTDQSMALGIERHTMKRVRKDVFDLYERLGLPKGFKVIPLTNCDKYAVNRTGVIINTRTREVISTSIDSKGYVRANITYKSPSNENVKYIRVHRAVALTYLAKQHDDQLEVNHISGIKTDNSITNLEWCTLQENMEHKRLNGLTSSLKGESNPSSKLTDSIVIEARTRHINGESASILAREYRVDVSTMCDIVNYSTWAHLDKTSTTIPTGSRD